MDRTFASSARVACLRPDRTKDFKMELVDFSLGVHYYKGITRSLWGETLNRCPMYCCFKHSSLKNQMTHLYSPVFFLLAPYIASYVQKTTLNHTTMQHKEDYTIITMTSPYQSVNFFEHPTYKMPIKMIFALFEYWDVIFFKEQTIMSERYIP